MEQTKRIRRPPDYSSARLVWNSRKGRLGRKLRRESFIFCINHLNSSNIHRQLLLESLYEELKQKKWLPSWKGDILNFVARELSHLDWDDLPEGIKYPLYRII